MLRLNLPEQPYWIALAGLQLRFHVRPLTTALMAAARAKATRAVGDLVEQVRAVREAGGDVVGLPDLDDQEHRTGLARMELIKALARAAIIDWAGVYPASGDDPAAVTDQTVGDLMRIYPIGEMFESAYVAGHELLSAEKNACGPALGGTGAAGPTTAGDAATTDRPAPTADAEQVASAALTSSTSP